MARRRRPPTTTAARRRREIFVVPTIPPAQGTASERPSTCPPTAVIEAKLIALEAYFVTHADSDDRGSAVDGYLASVPTGCTTPAQNRRLLALTSNLAGQAKREEESFDWVGRLVNAVLPIAKIAAGGLGLLVTGGALVYVAGKYSRPGKAVTGAAAVASKVTKVPIGAVRSRRSRVSDTEYAERRGMERAARQSGAKPPEYKGIGGPLPRKRRSNA